MRDHTKLRACEMADEIAVLLYHVTAGFPKEELGLAKRLGFLGNQDWSLIEPKIVETEKGHWQRLGKMVLIGKIYPIES